MNQKLNRTKTSAKKTTNQKTKALNISIASNIFFSVIFFTFGIQMKFEDKAEIPDVSHNKL